MAWSPKLTDLEEHEEEVDEVDEVEDDDSRLTRGITVKVFIDEDRKRFQRRERAVALRSMVYLY